MFVVYMYHDQLNRTNLERLQDSSITWIVTDASDPTIIHDAGLKACKLVYPCTASVPHVVDASGNTVSVEMRCPNQSETYAETVEEKDPNLVLSDSEL